MTSERTITEGRLGGDTPTEASKMVLSAKCIVGYYLGSVGLC